MLYFLVLVRNRENHDDQKTMLTVKSKLFLFGEFGVEDRSSLK